MSNHIITYSTELMANFKQVAAIAPQKKFHALQSPEHLPMLFSISNENALLITRQLTGQATGWAQHNISDSLSQYHNGAAITAKTFAVSQSTDKQFFHLALAVSVFGHDHLYLSLNNTVPSGTAPSLTVNWQAIPFDDPAYKNIRVIIENLHITQTGGEDFIVADVSRKTFPHPAHYLERYHIDTGDKREQQQYWHAMTLGGDVDPDITSVLGRKDSDEWVDGIYTLGNIGGKSQLIYTPLYNAVTPFAPPHVTRLFIPEQATTIAAAQTEEGLTDLFIAADKSIYYFAAGQQDDQAEGQKILANPLFESISHLYVFINNGTYVLWGLNRSNQIFYTSCKKENLTKPALWTVPVPILTHVHQVAPYVNSGDSSSTFFAAAGDRFTVATQSARTSLWDFNEVALKAPDDAKAKKISSYTTLIQLTDEDKLPVPDTHLYLSTSSRTGVYINQLYYVLSPEPLGIPTDANGNITLIQELDDLTGAQLYVRTATGAAVTINPMNAPFQKLAALDTTDKVKNAAITEENGQKRQLVSNNLSSDELQRVAATNKNLGTAYNDTQKRTLLMAGPPSSGLAVLSMPPTGNRVYLPGVGWSLFSAIGDLFSWMASGISNAFNTTIDFIQNEASKLWHLVLKIGDTIYNAVLDCVETIVAAVRWVYDKIKTAIEDLIKFLEFLFQWKDITRTKKVIYHLSEITVKHQLKEVAGLRKQVHAEFDSLIKTIEKWADIADVAGSTSLKKATKPTEGQSAPGQLLTYHYNENVQNSQVPALLHAQDLNEDLLKSLIRIMEGQKEIFVNVITKFGKLIAELPGLSLADVLKKIAGILASEFLRGFQLFVDILFDIVEAIGKMITSLLTAPLHIPVVSDILNFFGVGSVSILDLLCWVVAVPATLGYKICFQKAPFGDDELSNALLNMKDYATLKTNLLTGIWPSQVPEHQKSALYASCHFTSGIASIFSSPFAFKEAISKGKASLASDMNTFLGIISGGLNLVTALEAPRYPIGNEKVDWFNSAQNGLTVGNKLFHFILGRRTAGGLKAIDREVKVQIDGTLALYGLVAAGYHYYELNKHKEEIDKEQEGPEKEKNRINWKQSILEESANTSAYLSRLAFTGTHLGVKHFAPFIVLFTVVSGGLHISTCIVEAKR